MDILKYRSFYDQRAMLQEMKTYSSKLPIILIIYLVTLTHIREM